MLFGQQYQSDPTMYIRSSDMYGPRDANIFTQSRGQPYGQPQQYNNYNNNQFNNIQPRTRFEREQQREQENNQRLQQPQQGRAQYTPEPNSMKTLLHCPDQNTTLFQPEHDRFNKDFAAEDKFNRDQQRRVKEMRYENRRLGSLERQGNIWQREEEHIQKSEAKRQYHADQYNNGKRNANGYRIIFNLLDQHIILQPFNTLILSRDSFQSNGTRLHMLEGWYELKTLINDLTTATIQQLVIKNSDTGGTRSGVDTIVPSHLQEHFQQKLKEKDQYYDIKHYAVQQQLLGQQSNSKYY